MKTLQNDNHIFSNPSQTLLFTCTFLQLCLIYKAHPISQMSTNKASISFYNQAMLECTSALPKKIFTPVDVQNG